MVVEKEAEVVAASPVPGKPEVAPDSDERLREEAAGPPVVLEGPQAPVSPPEDLPLAGPATPEGLRLPLWQLEIATGGLLGLLLLATLWLVRRSRRRFSRM